MPISLIQSFFLLLTILSSYMVIGQSRVGAPNEAIANATSTTSGIWSIWHNPAGISDQPQLSAAISYRTVQNIEGFNTAGFGIVYPIKVGALGLGVSRFGDQLYNEQQVSISYGNKFGITDLGIQLSYHQYHFEGFGNKGVPIISFGGITTLSKKFLIGAFIKNITQAKISDFQDERIPTIMQMGISYRPLESIVLNVDLQKDIEFDASVLLGISYAIIDHFIIKTGFSTNTSSQFFGLDFKPNNIRGTLSYAVSHQELLGYSHQVSIQYDLKTKP